MKHCRVVSRGRSRSRSTQRYDEGPAETGFIIVRLEPKYAGLAGQTLYDAALAPMPVRAASRTPALPHLVKFLDDQGLRRSTRLVVTTSPEHIAKLEKEARASKSLAPLRSLRQYWRVDARGLKRELSVQRALAAEFMTVPGVEYAEPERRLSLPSAVSPDDEYFEDQFYLGAPPAGGINATAVWELGFDGSGIGFVDIEGGWFVDHADLPAARISMISGDTMSIENMSHGTSVLGIVAGVDNLEGVVGVAPGVSRIVLSSVFKSLTGTDELLLVDAIVNAITHSVPGDVILLEWQLREGDDRLPVELTFENFDAIRLASALGRVVIEAAGTGRVGKNGNPDLGIALDDVVYDGVNVLRRGGRESGAVMVAASAGTMFLPREDSNYGTRIDCFAPGEDITTCDYDEDESGPDQSIYRYDFGQTSAASAIVAGAAVLVQSVWLARTGATQGPLAVRAVLSDPAFNWPQGASTHRIGWMPDLGRIVEANLPDVYCRDNVLDDGRVPTTGILSASPDIIVRRVPVANPDLAFGEASGTAGDTALSDTVIAGAAHSVYVRLLNRGGGDAAGCTVDVYWSEPATLIMPPQWHLIGTTALFDVPSGGTLAVSPELVWPASEVPASGHYCFIAVAHHPEDAALLPGNISWQGFLELIVGNNNIAWRNFQVVDMESDAIGEWLRLPFRVRGAPDVARVFSLEVGVSGMTAGAVWLEVPKALATQFQRARLPVPARNAALRRLEDAPGARRDHIALVDLAVEAGLRRRTVVLDRDAEHRCALHIRRPMKIVRSSAKVIVKQSFKGTTVGCLTWSFPRPR